MKRKNQRKPARKPARKLKRPETQAIVKAQQQVQIVSIPEAIEKVLILGDLASLTPQDRVDYYKRVCDSLGLNPLTMPFSYILFKEFDGGTAKLSLYANKSCTEQLRKIHGVSVVPPLRRHRTADIVTVEADVRDKTGRTDSASGSVPLYKIKDGRRIDFDGKDLCNAEMKCETKAKRRATLSICGLAILDESELDTMEVVGGVTPDGRIYQYRDTGPPQLTEEASEATESLKARGLWCEEHHCVRNAKHLEVCESSRKATEKPAQTVPVREAQPTKETAKPKPAKKEPPKPIETKYSLTIDWNLDRANPVLTGNLEELGVFLAAAQPPIRLEWGKDELWHAHAVNVHAIMQVASQNAFKVVEIHPNQVPPGGQQSVAPPPARKPADRAGAVTSSAAPSAGPSLVCGVVERVTSPTTAKGQPMRQVTILVDGKKPTFGCFQKDLFDYLDKAKGAIEAWTTTSGKYLNLVGLKSIVTLKGKVEFDEDMKTPVIRTDREAGSPKLWE